MRTAAVVHLDRLRHNIELTVNKYMAPGAELIAVLKGDAYGCGIAGVYPVFRGCGVKKYAVAVWEEGRALREAGAADEDIYILGDICRHQYGELFTWRLTPTVFCVETAEELSRMAEERGSLLHHSL